jgi:hypothetical protein
LPASKSSHAGIRKRFWPLEAFNSGVARCVPREARRPVLFATPESASAIFAISALIEVFETFVAFVV